MRRRSTSRPQTRPHRDAVYADIGLTYRTQDGQVYGWDVDSRGSARDRNSSYAPDQRYDTVNYLRYAGVSRKWEIAVPNGDYSVKLVAGDPYYSRRIIAVDVEGQRLLEGVTDSRQPYIEAKRTVTVSDGRLTLTNANVPDRHNPLAFIEIEAVHDGGGSGGGGPGDDPATGVIAGRSFNDNNNDGAYNAGDQLTGGKTFFIDLDRDGKQDSDEPATRSQSDGTYALNNLAAGTYRVTRVYPSGYRMSGNTPGYADVTLAAGATVTNIDFGSTNRPAGENNSPPANPNPSPTPTPTPGDATIAGRSFNDNNNDGVFNAGDQLTSGKTFFIDLDRDGRQDADEPATKSRSDGSYSLSGLTAGTYRVVRVYPSGYRMSGDTPGYIDVTLAAGATATNIDFGSTNRPAGDSNPAPVDPSPIDPAPADPAPGLPGVRVTATTPTVAENDPAHPGRFVIDRTGDLSGDLLVRFNLRGTAINDTDYQTIFSQVVIPAGSSKVLVDVVPIDDSIVEGDESVSLVLASQTTYTLGQGGSATVTITDDDTPAVVGTSIDWKTAAASPGSHSEQFGGTIGGKFYIFGGYVDGTYVASSRVDAYDPRTGQWTRQRDLPEGITHVAQAIDGDLMYMVGGYPAVNGKQVFATKHVWRYDATRDTYTALPDLPVARGGGGAAKLGDTLYYMGGSDINRRDAAEVWSLDLSHLSAGWRQRRSLPQARNHPAAAAINGKVYFIGGQTAQDSAATFFDNVWIYDPFADQWDTNAPGRMTSPPRSHITSSTFVYQNQIYVAGGEGPGAKLRDVDRYDPATNRWTTLTSLPGARLAGVGDILNGKLIFNGGYSGRFESTTYIGTFV